MFYAIIFLAQQPLTLVGFPTVHFTAKSLPPDCQYYQAAKLVALFSMASCILCILHSVAYRMPFVRLQCVRACTALKAENVLVYPLMQTQRLLHAGCSILTMPFEEKRCFLCLVSVGSLHLGIHGLKIITVQVLVPITVLAVYHAFAYCAKNFSHNKLWRQYGVKAHSFLARHQVPECPHIQYHCWHTC